MRHELETSTSFALSGVSYHLLNLNTLESKKLEMGLLLPKSGRLLILALSQLACLLSDPVLAWFPRCLGSVTTEWTSAAPLIVAALSLKAH